MGTTPLHHALHRRMAKRHLTIRGLANASHPLHHQAPERYAKLSKSTAQAVLTPGYINAYRPSTAITNTLIALLYDGDANAFDHDAGGLIGHSQPRTRTGTTHAPLTPVVHYLEGEAPLKQGQRRGQPHCPGTTFLFTTRSDALAPTLPSGTTLECRPLNDDTLRADDSTIGRCIILQATRSGALTAAWHLGGPTFERAHTRFLLHPHHTVYGVAHATTPRLPTGTAPTQPADQHTAPKPKQRSPRPPSRQGRKDLTFPLPPNLRAHLTLTAQQQGKPVRQLVEDALDELLDAAEHDPTTIPTKDALLRLPESAYAVVTHALNPDTHARLKTLAATLTRDRGDRYLLKELALHALTGYLNAEA